MSKPARPQTETMELSIVLPCLNEERTVGKCVAQAADFLKREGLRGEIVVADNGSTDCSREVALENGARWWRSKREATGALCEAQFRRLTAGTSSWPTPTRATI